MTGAWSPSRLRIVGVAAMVRPLITGTIYMLKRHHHRREISGWRLIFLALSVVIASQLQAQEDDPFFDPFEDEHPPAEIATISDPMERFNRSMFSFNDRLYYWVLKPTAQTYAFIVPEAARLCVRRFFVNAAAPVRIVNCLVQGKYGDSRVESKRLLINSTWGAAGLFDPARSQFDLTPRDEDTGQTLTKSGAASGPYIVWPLFGPASVRYTGGRVVDRFLKPWFWVAESTTLLGIRLFELVNGVSLRLGDYEDLKASALDPYIALRDAFVRNRLHRINDADRVSPSAP
jgi:phospholipid-binding lipoprotein MlaA